MEGRHIPVLLHEAIEFLDIQPTDTVVDATLGGAGHAKEIVARQDARGTFIGFDLDEDAIARAQKALARAEPRVILIESNFRELGRALGARGVRVIDKAFFDLGWSSFQLEAGRGFSFSAKGGSASGGNNDPLVMTYAKKPAPGILDAATIVNAWEESSIADILYGWGEERYSRRIAKAIVARRAVRPILTAGDLAEIVRSAVPRKSGKIHPATKTFQALRIAVNDELGALEEGLTEAWHVLRPRGRLAVIAFHSLEDRIVKRYFAALQKSGSAERLTKKPVAPAPAELRENPRARSAKLRVIQKV